MVGRAAERFNLRIHGFALMPNHFHLMVESIEGNLGEAMKYVTSQYGYFLNQKMDWDGPVFRGRYKNKPVYLEEHWTYLLAYLHLKPVRARLVAEPEEAVWTSHPAYLGRRSGLEWLTTEKMSEYFEAAGGYRSFISEVKKRSPVPEGFESVTFDSQQSSRMLVTKQESAGPRMEVEIALSEVRNKNRLVRGWRWR